MFRLTRNIQMPLMIDGPATGIAGSPELTRDAILDELNRDDAPIKEEAIPLEKPAKKALKEDEESEPEEDDEDSDDSDEDDQDDDEESLEDRIEKELKEDLAEPDEDKLELQTPTSRREILTKYPKLFKDFPYLETAYYREQAFTKILPTIKDAELAVDKAQTLDNFETELKAGNLENVLKSVKEGSPKSFLKVADDYLDVLARVDEKAYMHVVTNLTKHTILQMVKTAREIGNEPLEQAAQILNQFVFNTTRYQSLTKLAGDGKEEPEDTKAKEIADREKALVNRKYTDNSKDLETKVTGKFKATIEANIDPKDSMPEYVKKHAVKEAFDELETLIGKDARFRVIVDKLWERAFESDFSPSSMDKLRAAFISKAGTLLPSVIAKVRNDALRGLRKKANDDDSRPRKESKDDGEPRRKTGSNKGDESRRRNDSGSKSKVPDGMTALEYLMADD